MSNPQGPGRQGRKAGKGQSKAPQPHHQAAAGPPGRSEQHQIGPRSGEQDHMAHQMDPSHPSQSKDRD